jgi:hypothetical protein
MWAYFVAGVAVMQNHARYEDQQIARSIRQTT